MNASPTSSPTKTSPAKPLRTAPLILEEEFLGARAKLLELAAILDRVDRAGGDSVSDQAKMRSIRQAMELLIGGTASAGRAEAIQLLFSRPYQSDWRESFDLPRSQPARKN